MVGHLEHDGFILITAESNKDISAGFGHVRIRACPRSSPQSELGCPLHMELAMMHGTVSQVEVDQTLIGNTHFLGYGLEIGDRITIDSHRNRLS